MSNIVTPQLFRAAPILKTSAMQTILDPIRVRPQLVFFAVEEIPPPPGGEIVQPVTVRNIGLPMMTGYRSFWN